MIEHMEEQNPMNGNYKGIYHGLITDLDEEFVEN